MENYLIEDYRRKQDRKKTLANEAARNKRKRAIKLFEDGLHDVGVIAEALETTERTVREYLGEARLGRIDAENNEVAENPFETGKTSKGKGQKVESSREGTGSKKGSSKSKKYTERDAQKYSDERDQAIIMLSREGLPLSEVVNSLRGLGFILTKDQVKERYVALGLPIYTKQELEEMRSKETRKKDNEAIRKKKKAEKAQIKCEVAEKKNEEKSRTKKEIESFTDIKKMIYKAIKDRKSQKAMRIGRFYLMNADFLSKEEKAELSRMVSTIELMRAKDKKQRKARKGKER